jgi:hypothetical protein
LWVCGCGSGYNGGNPGQNLNLASGNWNVGGVSTTNPGLRFLGGTSLNQSGTNVSGVMHLVDPPCFHLIENVNVSGSVNGSRLTLTSVPVNGQTLSSSTTGSDTSLTGTYAFSGAACAPADQGILNLTLVPPATGTWTGTLTSSQGPVTQVSATLTQSGPDAQGLFMLSGTATFSGGTCLASGTVTGLAVGATYTLIVAPGGSIESIVISGVLTDPATATALPVIYSSTATGCVDSGTGNLSKS